MNRYIRYCTDSPNPDKESLRAEIERQMAESNVPVQVIPPGVVGEQHKPFTINTNGKAKSASKKPVDDEDD